MMLTAYQINDRHRLYRCEHLPIRKIERRLRMSWRAIKKYLDAPAQGPTQRQGESRLDPCEADTLCSCSNRAEVLPCADPGLTPKAAQRDQRHPYRYG